MMNQQRGRPPKRIQQNAQYIEPFLQYVLSDKSKQNMYFHFKSTLGRFFAFVDKDLVHCNIDDINAFLRKFDNTKTRATKKHHLKYFFRFMINNNVEGYRDRIDRETLVELLKM